MAVRRALRPRAERTVNPRGRGREATLHDTGGSAAAAAGGRVLSVRSSVVDVAFPGELPGLHEALVVADGRRALVLEVEQLQGRRVVRTVALGNTEGLARGLAVERTGRCVHVPVGPATLGRVLNVLGE